MSLTKKYLNPQNDVAFKHIFGQEKNKDILLSMLNAVLKKQIHKPLKEVRFVSPIQEGKTVYQKRSAIDVLCKDQDDCTYIIEMQVEKDSEFRERAQYYTAKAFSNQSERGGDYANLKKVIFLAFCNFSIFPEKKDFKSDHQIRDIVTHENDLNKMGFTFVDLSKFKRYETNHVSELTLEHKFYYFLKYASEIEDDELENLIGKDNIIKKAFYELVSSFWKKEELEEYEAAEKGRRDYYNIIAQRVREGRKEGIKEGKEEGKKEREREIAKQMLAKHMDEKFISEVTGLALDEIKALF